MPFREVVRFATIDVRLVSMWSVVISAVLVMVATSASASPPPASPPPLADVLARGFEVVTLDGETVTLESLLGSGRPVVIEFWATWCAPCRKTIPHLRDLEAKYAERLVVIGLTVDRFPKDREKVESFANQFQITWPIAFASDELFRFMNNRDDVAVAKLFVFDKAHALVKYIPRYSPFTPRHLRAAVDQAMSAQ